MNPAIKVTTPTGDERDWGREITFALRPTFCGKVLKMKAGTKGGYQFHLKEECHYVLSGQLKLIDAAGERIVSAGQAWFVPSRVAHQEEALTDCVILEVSDPLLNDRVRIDQEPGGLPSQTPVEAAKKLRALALTFSDRANDLLERAKIILRDGAIA